MVFASVNVVCESVLKCSCFCVFQEYMPLPPAEETEENDSQEPKFQFSYVECLMYLFHQLGRKYPEFLTDESNAERLKDFRLR